jgi:hypothetical protein
MVLSLTITAPKLWRVHVDLLAIASTTPIQYASHSGLPFFPVSEVKEFT